MLREVLFISALTIYEVTEECPSPELIVTADIILPHSSKRSTFYQQYRQEKWWMHVISIIMSVFWS